MAAARLKASIGILSIAALLALVPAADATYLGENGKISFDVYDSNGNPTVYTMNPDGSGRTPLVPGGADSAWSADGQRIAYACQATPNQVFFPRNTCTANADGTGVTVLDNFGRAPQRQPFWSPDGLRLLIDNPQPLGGHGGLESQSLWRITAADGSDHILMADNSASGSWSPNGFIVYTEGEPPAPFGPPGDFWVSKVFAQAPNTGFRLTDSGADGSPDWSPDGTKIVFVSCRNGSTCELYTMDCRRLERDRDPERGIRRKPAPCGRRTAARSCSTAAATCISSTPTDRGKPTSRTLPAWAKRAPPGSVPRSGNMPGRRGRRRSGCRWCPRSSSASSRTAPTARRSHTLRVRLRTIAPDS